MSLATAHLEHFWPGLQTQGPLDFFSCMDLIFFYVLLAIYSQFCPFHLWCTVGDFIFWWSIFNYYSEYFLCDQANPPLPHGSSWQLFFVAVLQKASGNHAPCKSHFSRKPRIPICSKYWQSVLKSPPPPKPVVKFWQCVCEFELT